MRKPLVLQATHMAGALALGQEVVHTAVAQMDRVMASGVMMTDAFQTMFVCACLRLAAVQEGVFIAPSAVVAGMAGIPGTHPPSHSMPAACPGACVPRLLTCPHMQRLLPCRSLHCALFCLPGGL